MNDLKILPLFLFIIITTTMTAQQLTQHQWENRIILLLTNDVNSTVYQKQLLRFKAAEKGLLERRIVVYHVTPQTYQTGINTLTKTQNSTTFYKKFKQTDAPFEVVLIGLDGGAKLRSNTALSCQELFAIIDVMPMRKAELKRNKSSF